MFHKTSIILWICLLFFGHSYRVVRAQNTHEHNRRSVVVNELVVNAENNYRSVVYKSEKRGVVDMRNLLKSSRMEECWIFLPREKKWIEIGRGEAPEKKFDNRYVTKVRLDVRFMERLMAQNSLLVLYHIHPAHSQLLEDKMKMRSENGNLVNANEGEKERVLFLMRRAFPSEQDLRNMIENSMLFYAHNPQGNITFKICSYYGITEYYLTEKGRIYFADSGFNCMKKIVVTCYEIQRQMVVAGDICEQEIRKSINLFYRINRHSKQNRQSPSRIKKGFNLQIAAAVESMSGDYVEIAFMPY